MYDFLNDFLDHSWEEYIALSSTEQACYEALVRDEEWDPGKYYQNSFVSYPEYCAMCKKCISYYANMFNLGPYSINRIFEKYFMPKD